MKIIGPIPNHILKLMPQENRKPLGKAGMTSKEIDIVQALRSEKELQRKIADYLRIREIAFCNPRMDKRSTMTLGWPDFTFAIKGMPIAFECKKSNGKTSQDQIKCHQNMTKNGWIVYLVRSFEQAVDIINSL